MWVCLLQRVPKLCSFGNRLYSTIQKPTLARLGKLRENVSTGNITWLDTEFTFLTSTGPRVTGLFQQPEITTNESIYYQRGPFEARVSHNYIGGASRFFSVSRSPAAKARTTIS